MRLVFAGTPGPAVPSLQALLSSDHEVVAVVTRPPARAGRGRKAVVSPVRALAESHGIPVLDPVRPAEPEFVAALTELAPDCVPVVAYGALVPPPALAVPVHGWVNLHFSLLPAWRGAAPVQHAVIAGDEVTGATAFVLEAGMDTGPVLGTLTEAVRPTDTSGDLLERLAVAGAGLLVATLDALEAGDVRAVAQPSQGVSLAPKLTPDDVRVRWEHPALAVDRLVRGATPAPGAWTMLAGRRLKLRPVVVTGSSLAAPGQVMVGPDGVLVGTGSGDVRLEQVQPEGKGWMSATDWARGARPDGQVLG